MSRPAPSALPLRPLEIHRVSGGQPPRPPAYVAGVPLLLAALLALAGLNLWSHLRPPLSAWIGSSTHPLRPAVPAPAPALNPSLASLSPVFTPEVRAWEAAILRWSDQFHLDPSLVATVMQIESCGHPAVVSGAGAMGLFQVMPFHFTAQENALDPEDNAQRGLQYLARAVELSAGDPSLALAGYNAGHGVIPLPPAQWPAETQRYVAWGTGILHDVEQGLTSSPTLADWLAAGGAGLCQRAAAELAPDA